MYGVSEGTHLAIWAAVPSPFVADGELDTRVVADQARHLAAAGVDGVFACGTTGEFASLTTDERRRLAEEWAAQRPAGVGLGVHVGHTTLSDAQALARHAAGLGVDMIAAVAPFYGTGARVTAVVDHLARIAEAAPEVPFCYYHIPGLTGLHLRPSEIAAQAVERIPMFRAVKFTDGDLLEFARTKEVSPAVEVFFGKDELLPAALGFGARAVIGSLYNFLTPLARQVAAEAAEGRHADAARLHRPFRRVAEVADRHGSLAVVKELAGRFGPAAGSCRSPWGALTDAARTEIDLLAVELAAEGSRVGEHGMSRRPIYREAQVRLKEYIRTHQMRPGDRLPPEAALAVELGVSRPSLREATKSLQTLGVIEAQHGNGLFVSAFSFRPIIEQLPYGLIDSDTHFSEILVAREALEVGLMPFAASRPTRPELIECERLAGVMTEREAAGESSADVDKEFHLQLYRGLHNTLVDNVIDTFWELFAQLGGAFSRMPGRPLGPMHLAIVRALQAGDATLAAIEMRAHFDDVRARTAAIDSSVVQPVPFRPVGGERD